MSPDLAFGISMRISLSPTAAIAMLLLATTSHSFANDYKSGARLGSAIAGLTSKTSNVTTPVEYGSGWYLRGDMGLSVMQSLSVEFARNARSGDADGQLDHGYSYGFGAGFIFNDKIRADVLYEYYSAREWDGSASGCGVDGTGTAYTGTCTSSDRGNFDAQTVTLNVYANLGSLNGFTPYVGAGVGLAHVNYSATRSSLNCTVDAGENCDLGTHSGGSANPESFSGSQTFQGGSSINMAYALTAGIDYQFSNTMTLDVGYRMTEILDGISLSASTGSGVVEFDGAQLHEIRAGIRYELW